MNMKLKYLLLAAILCTLCSTLTKVDTPNQNFPLISTLYYIQQNLFFISKTQNTFGYIQKQSGTYLSKWSLLSNQKIAYYSQNQIYTSGSNGSYQFSIFSQNQDKIGSLKININISNEINSTNFQSVQVLKNGIYFISNNQLFLNQYTYDTPPVTQKIQLQLQTNQELLQIQNLSDKLLVFSTKNNQICSTIVDVLNIGNKKCIDKINSQIQRISVSDKYVFVFYGNNNVQLLDDGFNIVSVFSENVLQYFKGSASFGGFRTYNVTSGSKQNWKLVAHQSQGTPNSLQLISGEYILKEGTEVISKLPNISSEPVSLWLNKKQAAVGRAFGRYELAVQFNSGVINFYQIKAEPGKDPITVLKWSK